MPGIWEVDSTNSPDIVELSSGEVSIYRYRDLRTTKRLDSDRNFTFTEKQPYSIKELEDFFAQVIEMQPQLENARRLFNPLFCHYIQDVRGRTTMLNLRHFEEVSFNTDSPNSFFTVKDTEDIFKWDRNTPILFDVQSFREDETPLIEAIEALRETGISEVFVNYGTLSHPAILLREAGVEVRQALNNYEIRRLRETPAAKEERPTMSEEIIRFIEKVDTYEREMDMSQVVIALDEIDDEAREKVGEKAYNLSLLLKAGINVPEGFSVTSEGYRAWIRSKGLDKNMRTFIKSLIQAYDKFEDKIVAVRSSSTTEDKANSSSAGIYLTTLNVRDHQELIAAIVRGFQSYDTGSAKEYRRQNQIEHEGEMPLIVQEMIDADASGVMFSSDNPKDNPGGVIINAVRGIGETLMSGRLTGDTYIVSSEGTLIDQIINPQDFLLTRTGEYPTAEGQRLVSALTENQAIRLSKIAKQIETIYVVPQDIEFAIKDNQIWILQTRQITTSY